MKNNFETQIDRLITRLNASGRAVGWKNQPQRLHDGQYIKGELFDYTILSSNYNCCFDAKESNRDYWQVLKKDVNQALNLKLVANQGINTFFLIYFYEFKSYGKLDIYDFWKKYPNKTRFKKDDFDFSFKLEKMFR